MFELEERRERTFPVERAILFSLVAHVVVFVLLLVAPDRRDSSDPRKGLLAALVPAEEDPEIPIPVIFRAPPESFRESPGPARESRGEAPPSDLDRRAGGGDPSRKGSDTPFWPAQSGITGLEKGTVATRAAEAARRGDEAEDAAREPREQNAMAFPEPAPRRNARSGRLDGLDRAIREAAEEVGEAGGEGAGFPNPEGGFVDSGPLSFDTSWYEWGPYAAEMVRRIKLHWEVPDLARMGWKGKLTIRFFILADGTVEGATIVRRSGVPPFDFAALQAILKSSPFRPLPKDLGHDREGVTVTFFYNIRPGDSEEAEGSR